MLYSETFFANLLLGVLLIYRRLLLENILMLASRRVATSFTKFPNASEGIKIVGEKFADPLEVNNLYIYLYIFFSN